MAHGFKTICEKCGSENVTITAYFNGEFIEFEFVCDDCGQVG
jgi:protein-arginine kinase activator protein McsA